MLPPDIAGRVDTTNGAIDVVGLGGAVDVRTTNGAITATFDDGRDSATLRSSNGAIDTVISGDVRGAFLSRRATVPSRFASVICAQTSTSGPRTAESR